MIALETTLHAAPRPHGGLEQFVRLYPGWASFAALTVGDLVLYGWRFDIEVLKSVVPGFVAMNPMTAFALALSGLSLWSLRDRERDARETRLGRAFATVVACIGMLRLFGYLAGWDWGIDTLFYAEKLEVVSGGWRNRMAPNTAMAFVLIGASLALLDVKTRRGRSFSDQLALGVILLTLFALVGYSYDAGSLHGLSGHIGMALNTATSLLALSLGVLCARPDEGFVALLMSDTSGGAVRRRLIPAALGIPIVLGWLQLMGQRARYYDASTGTALFVIATVVVLAAIVHRSAVALDRSERERRRADARTGDAPSFLDSIVENVPNMVFVKEAADLLGISEDITERKEAEAELRTRMEQMEAEIFQSSQKVQAAKLQLQAANMELESFSYSVSHDLRAPLRHVNEFADLLVQHAASALDDTGRRYLDKIRESAKRMGVLIDELLQFSKMSRTEVFSSRVSLRSTVEQVIADMHDETSGRAVEWRIGALPDVEADASMLRQALTNLIGNAVKYTRPRAKAVIEIGSIESHPSEIVVFVRDNGVGFDMQYAGKLFGVFQRLHRDDEFEGTGIGLASVRRIIERHGGRTWVDARVDRGAIFYFSLPVRAEARACAS